MIEEISESDVMEMKPVIKALIFNPASIKPRKVHHLLDGTDKDYYIHKYCNEPENIEGINIYMTHS